MLATATPALANKKLDDLTKRLDEYEANFIPTDKKNLKTTLPGVENWPAFAARTKIRTGDEAGNKIVQFKPYRYQRRAIKRITRYRNSQILKSRQLGASEFICSYLLCRALTEPGFVGVVISKGQKDSTKLNERVKFMADSIVGEDFTWTTNNKTELSWKNRGTLYFLPAVGKSGRGIPACAVLFIDEADFIDDVDSIYRGASPALTKLGKAGKIILASTPDLEAGWFGQLWSKGLPTDWYSYVERRDWKALQDLLDAVPDNWNRMAFHYSEHPEYGADPNWAANHKKEMKYTTAQWDSEYELKFGSTSSAIYPTALVNRATRGSWLECGLVTDTYIMGIDPNAGGDDYFVSLVIDISKKPYSVVHMYREHLRSTPYSLARVVDQIDAFQPMKIMVEKNSMGVVIAEALAQKVSSYNIDTIFMSEPVKNITTDRVLYLLESDYLIFPDGIIPSELKAFKRTEKGRREAATGNHDDTVMGLAVCTALLPETEDVTSFLLAL